MSSKFIIYQLEWQSDGLQVSNAITLRWERLYSWASLLIKESKSNKKRMTRNRGLSTGHGKACWSSRVQETLLRAFGVHKVHDIGRVQGFSLESKSFGDFSHPSPSTRRFPTKCTEGNCKP